MADEKEHPFAHRIEVVSGTTLTLADYLAGRLQPWRVPIMLLHGGIRVTRGGRDRLATLDTPVSAGDLIVIDDSVGKTWPELSQTATRDYRDLVLCTGRYERGGDKDAFLLNQCAAVLVDSRAVDLGATVPTLTDVVASLTPLGTHPIRHFILVAHATPYGDIDLKLRPSRPSDEGVLPDPSKMSWESLNEAMDEGTLFIVPPVRPTPPALPRLLPRPTDSQGKFTRCAVIIRGCSSGVHQILLDKIREAFGYMIDSVVMPKFFETTDVIKTTPAAKPPALVEYMMHDYTVYSPVPIGRATLIKALQKHKFKNWLDVPVPDSAWDRLLPEKIPQGLTRTPVGSVEAIIPGRDKTATIRTFLDTFRLQIGGIDIERDAPPTDADVRAAVIAGLDRMPMFQDTVWPFWMRFRLPSRRAFDDMWSYRQLPHGPGRWRVWAESNQYTVRTPMLLEDNRTLICNYHPRGEAGTATRALMYDDTRIFGISSAKLPAHWAKGVEPGGTA